MWNLERVSAGCTVSRWRGRISGQVSSRLHRRYRGRGERHTMRGGGEGGGLCKKVNLRPAFVAAAATMQRRLFTGSGPACCLFIAARTTAVSGYPRQVPAKDAK